MLTNSHFQTLILSPDPTIRWITAESMSKLCSCLGPTTLASEVKYLVDTIVASREPASRAGCALALGCIHSQVGAMAAGIHMRQIHSLLMTLTNDLHPTVHFWAYEGLSRVIESAGLTFAGYSMATLGLISQQYVGDKSHHLIASNSFSNLEQEFPSTPQLAICLDALINCFGPDLQDATKPRALISSLVASLALEDQAKSQTVSFQCSQHLVVYTARDFNIQEFSSSLYAALLSGSILVRQEATKAYAELCKVDVQALPDERQRDSHSNLWIILDNQPTDPGIREVLMLWLRHTDIDEANEWITKLLGMLTAARSEDEATAEPSVEQAEVEGQDDEIAGLGGQTKVERDESKLSESYGLRWQTRLFAIEMALALLQDVREQIDHMPSLEAVMLARVNDVVKLSFLSSTSSIASLRLRGLQTLDLVLAVSDARSDDRKAESTDWLQIYAGHPDPDFPEVSILEQFQAQIASALAPGFGADSSPELMAQAAHVCATFLSVGIVQTPERMGRILQLLSSALEGIQGRATSPGGHDAKTVSRLAILTSWAELQIASLDQPYLVEVMKPHTAVLAPLWLSILSEFAKLRFENDISTALGTPSSADPPELLYSAFNRETFLKASRGIQERLLFLVLT